MREKSYNIDVKYISKCHPKLRHQKEQNSKLDHINLKKKINMAKHTEKIKRTYTLEKYICNSYHRQ